MVVDLLLEVSVAVGNSLFCCCESRCWNCLSSLDHGVQVKLSTAAKNYSWYNAHNNWLDNLVLSPN